MQEERVAVAVIGCGLIGSEWDEGAAGGGFPRTHAAAFAQSRRARLAAFCDSSPVRAQCAAQRWGGASYSRVEDLFAANRIDIAVIATSTRVRASVILPALAAGVKLLVIEKPLAASVAEARELVDAIARSGARSLVNFSRRWDPAMRRIREQIQAARYGAVQRLVGYYGKGIANNGSHMVDLVSFLCAARPLRARALGSPLPPGESAWAQGLDPAIDAQLVFCDESGREFQLTMLGTDQSAFTCFELRLVARDALWDISRGGRRIAHAPVADDPDYPGYRIPGQAQDLPASLREAMVLMAAEAVGLARGEIEHASCDVGMALQTAVAVEAVLRSAQEGGRWVDVELASG